MPPAPRRVPKGYKPANVVIKPPPTTYTREPLKRVKPKATATKKTVTVKKPTVKKPTVKKAPVKKAPAKKPVAKKAPPKKKPQSLSDWLRSDVDYQDQLRNFARTLSQFLGESTRQKAKVQGEYDAGIKQLGITRGRDLETLEDDFSGRGILHSGVYGNKVGEYEQDYQTALGDLGRQRTNLLGDLAAEQQRFQLEQQMASEQARRDAVRRRTAKIGS